MTRWFEDTPIGDPFPLGRHTFTAEKIQEFATKYDPQYFHLQDAGAEQSHFGGIIASGWHTASVGQRLMIDTLFADDERQRALGQEPGVPGPSPGFSNLFFKTPVRAGDTISYALTVTDKRKSNSLPGWGLLFNKVTGHNQDGELVYSIEIVAFSKLKHFTPTLKQRLGIWLATSPLLKRFRKS